MTNMQGAMSAAERSMRSVFVGNIPYEATEEQLRDIFSEVGPVVSFRLVYDRETGKPKGYGFCEYKDQEMALSAMRNLNGYELSGRALRVDNAASEKSKEELKNLQASLGGPPVESPYGSEVPPDKAPEVISKVVASLPPEQLYELMVQMKVCIENNPNEARNMLIHNPQLAYALLQAQVVMKIVKPEVAMSMLHGPAGPPIGLLPTPAVVQGPPVSNSQIPPPPAPPVNEIPSTFPPDAHRMSDQDLRAPPIIDLDMRPLPPPPPPMMAGDKEMRHLPAADQDLRTLNAPAGLPENRPFNDPRYAVPRPDMVPNKASPFDRPQHPVHVDNRPRFNGRGVPNIPPRMEDPRAMNIPPMGNIPPGRGAVNERMPPNSSEPPLIGGASPSAVSSPRPGNQSAIAAAAAAIAPHDQEKAALIMQVLQLTDQQISMLPPEQRQSIMILKEQISRSQRVS